MRNGPPNDVHPVLRRAAAPPAALDLLAQAQHGLDEAAAMETPNERYAIAHLAALRTAAAVLAVRGRPEPTERRRRQIRSAWEVLPEAAPELAEWSALFASGAPRRARAEAGIPGAAGPREADDLIRDAGVFLRLVERMLVGQPALPRPRVAAPEDEQEDGRERGEQRGGGGEQGGGRAGEPERGAGSAGTWAPGDAQTWATGSAGLRATGNAGLWASGSPETASGCPEPRVETQAEMRAEAALPPPPRIRPAARAAAARPQERRRPRAG